MINFTSFTVIIILIKNVLKRFTIKENKRTAAVKMNTKNKVLFSVTYFLLFYWIFIQVLVHCLPPPPFNIHILFGLRLNILILTTLKENLNSVI